MSDLDIEMERKGEECADNFPTNRPALNDSMLTPSWYGACQLCDKLTYCAYDQVP